jgi:hypothetical protein
LYYFDILIAIIQAPTEFSFAQAAEAAEQRARERVRTPQPQERFRDAEPKTPKGMKGGVLSSLVMKPILKHTIADADRTFATNSAAMTPVATHQPPPVKRPAKPVAMTNKAKKERAVRTSLTEQNIPHLAHRLLSMLL